jgi:ubiquinone/menaquinone biosynthesis C-methylase UbiE
VTPVLSETIMSDPARTPPLRTDYGHVAEDYEASRGVSIQFMKEFIEDFINTCELNSHTLVVDLGCGTGRFLRELAERKIPVIGIDISKRMLEKACLNQQSWRYFRSNLIAGDAIALPFHRGLFSSIILIHLLHLLSDWKEVLSEAIRVLRPDGTLVTGIIPAPAHVSTLMRFYSRRREELGYWYDHPGPHLEEIFEALNHEGANIEPHEIHSDVKISLRETLSYIDRRVFSSMWQNLPDVIHRQIMQELRIFTTSQFMNLEDEEQMHIKADLYYVTFG